MVIQLIFPIFKGCEAFEHLIQQYPLFLFFFSFFLLFILSFLYPPSDSSLQATLLVYQHSRRNQYQTCRIQHQYQVVNRAFIFCSSINGLMRQLLLDSEKQMKWLCLRQTRPENRKYTPRDFTIWNNRFHDYHGCIIKV